MNKEELYKELQKGNVNFISNNKEEQRLDELLFNIAIELDRYQDMTQEVLDYIVKHEEVNEIKEIYDIIKKWAC